MKKATQERIISKLKKDEIKMIDDRIEYYFENNDYVEDPEILFSFVIETGEFDISKNKEIKQYIKNNLK